MTSPIRAVDLDAVPPEGADAVLSLGSNLGDRVATLAAAVRELSAVPGLDLVAVSPVVETDPVGGPDQPDYLNAVVLARVSVSARQLLRACQDVESRHGRQRQVRWGARTLDVDIITYDALVTSDSHLQLPHPRAAERAFVLVPWLAVDPGASLPGRGGSRPVADLLGEIGGAGGVRTHPDVDLALPVGTPAPLGTSELAPGDGA